ncbi:MAG: hypothetical protein IKA74_01940 [Clostridia bacterium]|nr:hypothetical protein [Clostridia bacterium]
MTGFEIERKFLIEMPTDAEKHACSVSEIEQTYLLGEGSERVRARTENGVTVYTHTKKITLTPIKRIESEREIDRAEYEALLLSRDTERQTVRKRRLCIENGTKIFEIDIYPFWDSVAIMEVELSHEGEQFTPPPFIKIIREITDDYRFTNSAIAKEIPQI